MDSTDSASVCSLVQFLGPDPLPSLKVSKTFRAGGKAPLFTLDEYAAVLDPEIKAPIFPTVFPEIWDVREVIDQQEFDRRFDARYPSFLRQLTKIKGVAVSGGSMCALLGSEKFGPPRDLDLFLVGLNSPEEALGVAETVYYTVACNSHGCGYNTIRCVINSGVLSIYLGGGDKEPVEIQVILRLYKSPAEVVYGFDIPSCSLIYWEGKTWLTPLAAWSHAYRSNPVVPEFRSTTFEYRIEKYFHRGFALTFPFLDSEVLLTEDKTITMPYMTLEILHSNNGLAVGSIVSCVSNDVSDYVPYPNVALRSIPATFEGFENVINVSAILRGVSPRYTLAWCNTDNLENLKPIPEKRGDLIPFENFEATVWQILHGAISERGRIRVGRLVSLGLSTQEIQRIVGDVSDVLINHSGCYINPCHTVDRVGSAAIRAYETLKDITIDWCRVSDPSSQNVGSFNPIFTEPKDWYGVENFTEEPHVYENDGDWVASLFEALEEEETPTASGQFPCNTQCPFCLDPITENGKNIAKLPCGHICHLSAVHRARSNDLICSGISELMRQHPHWTCPICRGDGFAVEKNSDEESGAPDLMYLRRQCEISRRRATVNC